MHRFGEKNDKAILSFKIELNLNLKMLHHVRFMIEVLMTKAYMFNMFIYKSTAGFLKIVHQNNLISVEGTGYLH